MDGIGAVDGVWALAEMTLSAVAVIVRSNFIALKVGYWADPGNHVEGTIKL
jgi:hypothetical protein